MNSGTSYTCKRNSSKWVRFDRHVNNNSRDTINTIKAARKYFRSKVRVRFKNPMTHRYMKPVVGCYVEIDMRIR